MSISELSANKARVLVVIPAFNESETILDTIESLLQLSYRDFVFEVVVVNDGSNDGTGDIAADKGVHVINLSFNCGVGAAMKTGFQIAKQFGFDYVIQIDADGQHDSTQIANLFDGFSHPDIDLVIGNRFGNSGYHVSMGRFLAMRFLALLILLTTGKYYKDPTSGMRATGVRGIDLFATHYPSEYLGDTVESLVILSKARLIAKEVPVVMHSRQGGSPSNKKMKSVLHVFRTALMIILTHLLWRFPAKADRL